jgi:hypothetical protein
VTGSPTQICRDETACRYLSMFTENIEPYEDLDYERFKPLEREPHF